MRRRLLLIAACAALSTSCGGHEPPERAPKRPLPQADLCAEMKADHVRKALGAKVAECLTAAEGGGFGAQFSARRGATAVSLTVAYSLRYEEPSGFDRWLQFGERSGERVAMLGVGDGAVYDAAAGNMTAVADGLIISVTLQSSAPIERDGLPDRLLAVVQDAMETAARTGPTPRPQAGAAESSAAEIVADPRTVSPS